MTSGNFVMTNFNLLLCHRLLATMQSGCSPCCCSVPSPAPGGSFMRCKACLITWPVGLGVCVARSAVTGLGESGELGCESLSKEKYPLEERRGELNIDLFWNTPRLSTGEMALGLRRGGESGSPPPVEPRWPQRRSPLSFERVVCAEAPAAPRGAGSPPLSSLGVTAVEPSDRVGGLLGEQSGTVSLGSHHSAYSRSRLRGTWSCSWLCDSSDRAGSVASVWADGLTRQRAPTRSHSRSGFANKTDRRVYLTRNSAILWPTSQSRGHPVKRWESLVCTCSCSGAIPGSCPYWPPSASPLFGRNCWL